MGTLLCRVTLLSLLEPALQSSKSCQDGRKKNQINKCHKIFLLDLKWFVPLCYHYIARIENII